MRRLLRPLNSISILLLAVCGMLLTMCDDKDDSPSLPDLAADIDLSGINFTSDLRAVDGQRIKAGQTVMFKDGSTGGADKWLWEFEGIGTSTEQNPTVTWDSEVGQVNVKLTVTRSSDGKTATDEMELQVGPVDLFNKNIFSFESSESLAKWNTWSSTSTAEDGSWSGETRAKLEIDDSQGANGTSSSAKITRNYTKASGGDVAWLQLSTWQNNVGGNAVLKSNTTYVFSYYIKANAPTTFESTNLLNRGGVTGEEQDWKDFGAWKNDVDITTDWVKKVFEFTTSDLSQFATYEEGTANNAAPFFQLNPFDNVEGNFIIWIDEVSLKEKEQ